MPLPSHHPPHIYLDNTWYLFTGSTYRRLPFLQCEGGKEIVRDCLKKLALEFGLKLAAWVILDNHYHILVESQDGSELPRFFQRLHRSVSFELNRREGQRGRQVWHNYWDTCLRGKHDYWTRFNYIHHNPVKHGYVSCMSDWAWSSYGYYLTHKGQEWMADLFARYPVASWGDETDRF